MNNVVYLKEPGILYDMLFALKLRFNGERAYVFMRNEICFCEQNENFFSMIINKLSDISDRLLPFFYYDKDKNIRTAMMSYIREYINLTSPESELIEYFYSSLKDVKRLKQAVYKNYISDHCPDDFNPNSLVTIKSEIFTADLPSDVKMYLFDFLMYGESEIDEIIAELKKVETICRELNQINQSEIEHLLKRFESEHIYQLSTLFCMDITQCNIIYVSYCSLYIVANSFEKNKNTWISMLGLQISKILSTYCINRSYSHIDLYELSHVLYDKQRLKILDMLIKEEMYCAQIAKELDLCANSTIYHLKILENAGIIINRRNGKRIYYKINHNYFYAIIDYFRVKFIEG